MTAFFTSIVSFAASFLFLAFMPYSISTWGFARFIVPIFGLISGFFAIIMAFQRLSNLQEAKSIRKIKTLSIFSLILSVSSVIIAAILIVVLANVIPFEDAVVSVEQSSFEEDQIQIFFYDIDAGGVKMLETLLLPDSTLITFILERNNGSDKSGKQHKYSCIKTELNGNELLRRVIDEKPYGYTVDKDNGFYTTGKAMNRECLFFLNHYTNDGELIQKTSVGKHTGHLSPYKFFMQNNGNFLVYGNYLYQSPATGRDTSTSIIVTFNKDGEILDKSIHERLKWEFTGEVVLKPDNGLFVANYVTPGKDRPGQVPYLKAMNYDNQGELQWETSISDSVIFVPNDAICGNDDCFYIIGKHYELRKDCLLKLSSGGTLEWIKKMGETGTDVKAGDSPGQLPVSLTGIIPWQNESLLLAGNYFEPDRIMIDDKMIKIPGMYIAMYSLTGERLSHYFDNRYLYDISHVTKLSDSSCFLTGKRVIYSESSTTEENSTMLLLKFRDF